MLQASAVLPGEVVETRVTHGLNEVVVARSGLGRLAEIAVSIDEVSLTTYRADAVVVATPTGSTGYSLSAGGPILFPEARLLILQPVAAHMSPGTGLILDPESTVELQVGRGMESLLSVDGFPEVELTAGARVVVRRSQYVARFIRSRPPGAFYATLNQRLGLSFRSD